MSHYPHVTAILRILEDAYADVPQEALRAAADRGTALHGICCQHLAFMMGLCPKPSEIADEYTKAYAGFLDWIHKKQVTPYLVEQYSVNEKDGYCGTPDALVQYGDGTLVLIDMKFTSAILRLNHVQVQAYHKMAGYTRAQKLALIHIDPKTGEWEEVPVKSNPRDWLAFKSALNIHAWRGK